MDAGDDDGGEITRGIGAQQQALPQGNLAGHYCAAHHAAHVAHLERVVHLPNREGLCPEYCTDETAQDVQFPGVVKVRGVTSLSYSAASTAHISGVAIIARASS